MNEAYSESFNKPRKSQDNSSNYVESDQRDNDQNSESDENPGGESQQAGTLCGGALPLRGLGRLSIQSHDNVSLLVQKMLGHYPYPVAATKTLSLCSKVSRVRATSESKNDNTLED